MSTFGTYLYSGSYFSYLAELFFLIILLGTNFFSSEKRGITSFRRYCSYAMLIDAAAIILSVIFCHDLTLSDYEIGIINSVDGLVLWGFLMAGCKLIEESCTIKRPFLNLGLPYFCVIIYQLFFAKNSLPIGNVVIFISGTLQIIYLNHLFVRHDRKLMEQKSNIENRTVTWFGVLSVVIIAEMLVWFFLNLFTSPSGYLRIAYNLFMQVLYAFLAHYTIIQENTHLEVIDNSVPSTEEDANSPGEVAEVSFVSDLDNLMKKDKLYLNPDLSIELLSEQLHTNTTYVYKCIHEDIGSTFYDYINGFRIEDAKKMLLESEDKIEEIALSCGFNSSRSFQRVFKRFADVTPSQWRNDNKK